MQRTNFKDIKDLYSQNYPENFLSNEKKYPQPDNK